MKEVGEKIAARGQQGFPQERAIFRCRDGMILEPEKEAESGAAHSSEPGGAVATGQAERPTAAPGPTAIQDEPVILNLPLPLSSLSVPRTHPRSSLATSSIKTFQQLLLLTTP